MHDRSKDLNRINPLVKGIVVGMPICGRPVLPQWGLSLACQSYPLGTAVNLRMLEGKKWDAAREQIVEEALERNAAYVWFIDDDVIGPTNGIRELMYAMQNESLADPNVAVVAGVYCTKTDPPEPIIFKEKGKGVHWDWKAGQIFPVWAAGTGYMLIKTEVFRHLSKPWFKVIDNYDRTSGKIEMASDDIYFCRKLAEETNYKIVAHGGVLCIHYDVYTKKTFELPEDSFPLRDMEFIPTDSSEPAKQCVVG